MVTLFLQARILSVADLFLMPSETESFGLSALEAMACRLPTITTNAGGIPEIVLEGVTGFMSPVGDVEAMAANAIFILEDEDRLKSFKDNALNRAHDFDISLIVPIYEAYYEEVIEKSKAQQIPV